MKPDTASRLLYQEAALRSFLRTDNIAQSFIQNTPNYNMEDLQQLYFASASIKSKKMLIEFVKISTKQLCMSLRDKLPLFRYLNPENISTDLTDDELMLLIHEASHSMSLEQQIGGHGNIAFLVAKNIIFNLVGVNATATLNSFLKTPDLGSFSSRDKTFESPPFAKTDPFSTSSPPFPMPPPGTSSSQFPMKQTDTSLSLTPALNSPSSPYMTSYGSSPTIISTSVANLSFVSMNSSVPQNSNSFMTVSPSTPYTPTHLVTQSNPTPAITERPYRAEADVEPDFDTRSNASESSNTRFDVIGNSERSDDDDNARDILNQRSYKPQADVGPDSDTRSNASESAISELPYRHQADVEPDFDTRSNASEPVNTRFEVVGDNEGSDDDDNDNSRDIFNQRSRAEYPANRIDASYGMYDEDEDNMSIDSAHDDNEAEKFDDNDSEQSDNEAEKFDNDYNDKGSIVNNNRMMNYKTAHDDFYDEDQRSFEQEMLQDAEIKRVFEVSKFDDKFKNTPDSEEINSPSFNTPSSTPPPSPVAESTRQFPLRKRPRKRKAFRRIENKEEVVNKPEVVPIKPWLEPEEVPIKPWLEPEVDFKPSNESLSMINSSVDDTDGSTITNINEFVKRSQPAEKKLFAGDNMFDIMNDLKMKGIINLPAHPRNIAFSNIDS